jgi:Spherulation-specific family 4
VNQPMRDDSPVHRVTRRSLSRLLATLLSGRNGRRRLGGLAGCAALLAVLAGLIGLPVRASAAGHAPAAARVAASCQRTFVPSFPWSSAFWMRAMGSRPAPGVMLLDVTGTGAGNAPVQHFQILVRRAHARGVAVLGYSSTEYGRRPVAAVEADARHYRAWYRADGIFLDLAAPDRGHLPYYRTLATYIRRVNPRAVTWLNPGAYPDQAYLQVASVLVVFEGSYAEYRGLQVPRWVSHYRASRFAHVVHDTPGADLARAVRLGRLRRAGYMYLTDQGGSDPYMALPSYWTREVAAVAARC